MSKMGWSTIKLKNEVVPMTEVRPNIFLENSKEKFTVHMCENKLNHDGHMLQKHQLKEN